MEAITAFLRQYRKPFSAAILAGIVNITEVSLEPVIQELLQQNEIIELMPGIYKSAHIYVLRQTNYDRDWTYNVPAALAILQTLQRHRYTSIRSVANVMNVSRQYMYMYLTALASMGNIAMDRRGYYVTTTEGLDLIGMQVKYGILGKMRKAAGIKAERKTRITRGEHA